MQQVRGTKCHMISNESISQQLEAEVEHQYEVRANNEVTNANLWSRYVAMSILPLPMK